MRLHIIGAGSGSSLLALLMASLAVVLVICLGALARQTGSGVEAAPAGDEPHHAGADSTYLGQAKRLFDSGTHLPPSRLSAVGSTNSISVRSSSADSPPLSLLSTSSDRDPYLEQQLRLSIKSATGSSLSTTSFRPSFFSFVPTKKSKSSNLHRC